jgi:RND family efflux transporter MFP subunit
MNKMDINMPMQSDVVEQKPKGLAAQLMSVATFLAPFLVILGAIAAIAVLMITQSKPEEKGGNPHPTAVQFAVAQARPTTISIAVQGEARPRVEAALAAQVAGRVVWVSPVFAEGGAFTEGQVLVRIDEASYRLAVVRARAQVAQAEEAVAREEAEGELARQDWAVLGQGDPSPLAAREPQMALARAALDGARAQLQGAELDLARASIRAPFAGRVRTRRANVGDYVGPGAAVADVFATDVMEVRVPLADADLAALRTPVGFNATAANPGPLAHLTVVSGGRIRTWEGRLVRTEATVDAQTRLVYAVVAVRDPFSSRHAAPLAPGMFVTVRLDGSSRETLVAAPRSALKRNEFVYVIGADNKIDVRTVRPAQTTADEVLFREGLADGERVVVSHLASPQDGMAVTPIDRAAEAPAQPAAAQAPLELREKSATP